MASLIAEHGSRHVGFSSSVSGAWVFRPLWHPPGPGIEPASAALTGTFLSNCAPREVLIEKLIGYHLERDVQVVHKQSDASTSEETVWSL